MSQILVFSERDEFAFELLSKGRELKGGVKKGLGGVLLGEKAEERAQEYLSYGAQKVYLSQDPLLREFHADIYAQALHQAMEASNADTLLLASTKRGKEVAPRVAQRVGCGCITEAIGLGVMDGKLIAKRYALGGNTVATERVKSPKEVIAVVPKTFEANPVEKGEGELIHLDLWLDEPRLRVVERRAKGGETAKIEDAETLICVGRGVATEEDLEMIRRLAQALEGEIGCTKPPASDFGWFSEERVVGLSGKKCNPHLYIGIGISGQIQHTVGILGSKIIVAINKNKEAPIFKIADYGIVGDLYEVVPKLIDRLAR